MESDKRRYNEGDDEVNKQVHISADYSGTDGNRDVIEIFHDWSKENIIKWIIWIRLKWFPEVGLTIPIIVRVI